MQFWSYKKKLFSFLLGVLFFYAHFFVPMFSVYQDRLPETSSIFASNPIFGLQSLRLHYMTIGILPFITSALMLGVFFLINPHIKSWLVRHQKLFLAEKAMLYLVASFIASQIVSQLPEDSFLFGPVFTWFELMLSVASIDALLSYMKKIKLQKSPLTGFLALNVLGAYFYGVSSFGGFSVYDLFVIMTVHLCYIAYRSSFKINTSIMHFNSGKINESGIAFNCRYMSLGVMPFVYLSVFAFPALTFLYGHNVPPAQIIVQSPLILLSVAILAYLLTTIMNYGSSDKKSFVRDAEIIGLCWNGKYDAAELRRYVIKRQSMFTAIVIFTAIGVQGFSYTLGVQNSSFIGGVAWIIVISAFLDFKNGLKGDYYVE